MEFIALRIAHYQMHSQAKQRNINMFSSIGAPPDVTYGVIPLFA